MLSIQTNVAALDAAMNVTSTQGKLQNTIGQLSSGYRINSASDDAAGLGIAEVLEANIAQYAQAAQNTTDGQSVVQTASSALTEVNNILTRMSSLAMEAANSDVNQSANADANVTTEFGQLVTELDRISNDTTFNGTNLFTGAPASFTFQVGIGSTPANDTIAFTTFKVDSATLKVNALKLDRKGLQLVKSKIDRKDTRGLAARLESLGVAQDLREQMECLSRSVGGMPVLAAARASMTNPESRRAIDELAELASLLKAWDRNIVFDLTEIDELEYYTGVMFEFFSPNLTSELGRGGRYDSLLREFGADMPAVGYSFSMDRLVELA